MPTFDDREKGFENKYAHDKELEFKVMARRNKLLGLWAAGQMGIKGTAADVYAREVIEADFAQAGDEDVFAKVWKDLQAKKVQVSEHRLRKQMTDLLAEARAQVMKE